MKQKSGRPLLINIINVKDCEMDVCLTFTYKLLNGFSFYCGVTIYVSIMYDIAINLIVRDRVWLATKNNEPQLTYKWSIYYPIRRKPRRSRRARTRTSSPTRSAAGWRAPCSSCGCPILLACRLDLPTLSFCEKENYIILDQSRKRKIFSLTPFFLWLGNEAMDPLQIAINSDHHLSLLKPLCLPCFVGNRVSILFS